MYQSPSSATTTNSLNQEPRCINQFGTDSRLQQICDYKQNSLKSNNVAIENGSLGTNEEPTAIPFKFDEFNALINSEEFLENQPHKQRSPEQVKQLASSKGTAQEQQHQQPQHEQQQFQQQQQQVNLFRTPETFSVNNNNNNGNINSIDGHSWKQATNPGLSNGFLQQPSTGDENQETLTTPQVQFDDEGRRLQYFNQYQLMKETIYQETKSFFCDSYNPSSEPTDSNMANNNLQAKSINYNNAPYRNIYDSMVKQEKAYVEIVEQPAKCSLRFRYKCEGRSAGSLPGVNSNADNKTYPSIQIKNYTGRAVVVISCVTKEVPYLAHPHNIVGKEGCKKGICTVVLNNDSNMIRSFSSLGVQCVKRKDIEESLTLREAIKVDPYGNGFAHKLSSSNIDLNVVRLCFQVFIEGSTPNKCDVPLAPVVSDPIHDKKAMSDLVITKLSHCTAPASGGREIILLCDRISRDDIQIRFFEERDGKLIWETFTELAPTDVHKQVAICFKTPRYFNENIAQPVTANIQLKRSSDNQVSEPRLFKFLPSESDEDMITRKRAKINQLNQNLQHHHHNQQQHHYLNHHHHQQQQHQQQPQHQFHQAVCNISPVQNLPPGQQSIDLKPQQQLSPRLVRRGQESPFQQHPPGRSSASPQSRIASPVTPMQANSPAALPTLDRRVQQGPSLSPSANHHNQDSYAIEPPPQQQQNLIVRGEIIADDGKVVRLVDRPSQHPLAQSSSSDACRDRGEVGQEALNQHRYHEDNNKAALGLSLSRIDSDQLMRADMAFNPNENLDLGSSISIHLNGNGTSNNHHAAAPMP